MSPSATANRAPASPLATPAIAAKYAQNAWLGAPIGGEQAVAGGQKQAYAGGTIFWSQATGAFIVKGKILAAYDAAGGPASPLGFPTSDEFTTATGPIAQRFTNALALSSSATGTHFVQGAILGEYARLGWENGDLGLPTTSEYVGANGDRITDFQRGQIIWSPQTGAHAVHGAIHTEFSRLGHETGVLGRPVTSHFIGSTGAHVVNFEGGQIISSPKTGTHAVYGAIAKVYAGLGFEGGVLGKPITSEFTGAGARVVNFENGQIIWSAQTGAHAVYGAIAREYAALGWEGGPLGRPTSGEFNGATGARVQRFERGLMIWTPATGAHGVHGAILDKYAALRFENGALGAPLTSEFGGANGARVQNFANGQIIFTGSTGANSVQGAIAQEYGALGYEGGPLGVPTSDEFAGRNGARVNRFAHGLMVWTGRTGAFAVRGALLSGYAANGYEGGALGAPTTNEFPIAGGFAQDFEHGRLTFVNGRMNIVWPGPNVDARCRTGRVMCISKAERKLRWMIDGRVIKEMDARFGAAGTPTREGEFKVFSKVRDEVSYLYGNTPMPFAMYFSGGEAVHYSYDFATYGYSKTAFASHGCVNIRDWDGIQWLYDTQVKLGDKVVVYW
ncbi:hypothetical protein GCM10028815_29010 [Mariniluteicoccus flavus]